MSTKCFVSRILLAALVLSITTLAAAQPGPLTKARQTAADAKNGKLSPEAAAVIARELMDRSVTPQLVGIRLGSPELVNVLTTAQMDWQSGRFNGIQEEALVQALNRQLELGSAPEYSRIRLTELRRIRLLVWTKVPELSTGLRRHDVRISSPQNIFGPFMSPFEAYLVADWLIYSKLADDDFALTPAEESARGHNIDARGQPGLHAQPLNPRREELMKHMRALAAKWRTSDDLARSFADLLGR